jgi:hypothetical protein
MLPLRCCVCRLPSGSSRGSALELSSGVRKLVKPGISVCSVIRGRRPQSWLLMLQSEPSKRWPRQQPTDESLEQGRNWVLG